MRIYYDEEADFLEIFFGKPARTYAEETKHGIFIMKDEKTSEVKGLSIFGFKKRTKNFKEIKIKLSL